MTGQSLRDKTQKQVLFVCYGLGIGGIEKCLVNLINAMPEPEFAIDLLVLNPEYAMQPQIRRQVSYIDPFEYTLNTEFTMQEIRRRGGLWKHRRKVPAYLIHRVRIKLGLPLWTQFRPLEKEYDIAVAYSQNGLAPYYVADKVRAKRKVLWYHNGAYEKTGKAYALDREYYPRFDYVAAVSRDCARVLKDRFEMLEDRIVVLPNICDRDGILEAARGRIPDSFAPGGLHLVTVGRLAPEKGVELALEACKRLSDAGFDIRWHWVGDGPLRNNTREKLRRMGLEGIFLPEGSQDNPYPYIRHAGIYVQPSLYEAYSTTVTEARVLCRPIVATDVGGMRDQLTDGENGSIVKAEASALAEGIRQLLEDPELAQRYSRQLEKAQFTSGETLERYRETVFA